MLVFTLILSTGFALHYRAEKNKKTALRSASAWQSIHLSVQLISNEIADAVSDIGYLAAQNELDDLFRAGSVDAYTRIAKEYVSFLKTRRVYDQVRYIDNDGVEVVRANFNDGNPEIVPTDRLQNKCGRYYFKQAVDLEPGDIYLSKFDLNVEVGEMESPVKPVLRFAAPVRDVSGVRRGLVVINYTGSHLIDDVNTAGQASGVNTWMVNTEGYWLKGPDKEVEWGFMYTGRSEYTFERDYPKAWQRMLAADEGQFYSDGVLFTFSRVYPRQLANRAVAGTVHAPEDYFWILISTVPEDVLWADSLDTGKRLLALYGLTLVILAPASLLIARLSIRQKSLTRTMDRVLQHVPVLISYVDTDMRLRFHNSAYADLFGVNTARLNELHLASVLGPEGYENVRPYAERALKGEQVSFEQRMTFKGAGEHVIAAKYVPDVNNDGRVSGFFCVINDVTDLYEAQERERQHLLDLAHAQRINSMGEMVTEIAHEINQPLTSIVNFSGASENAMHSGDYDETQVIEWITAIRTHARRASDVVSRLRAFLRKGESEYAPVDINELVTDVVGWMKSETRRHGIEVSLDLQLDIPSVPADDILIEQVVLNLVRNAIEALCEKHDGDRRLDVQTTFDGSEVRVAVSDNGPGIQQEIDDRIFQSFVTSKQQGLGMGLSVSRSIVEGHGGELRVDRASTAATTLVFTIPVTREGDND